MDWKFTGYDKIPASTTRWDADESTMRQLTKLKWVATEKIHGASFCFVLEPGRIRCASRRALIAPDDAFFGHQRVLARLAPSLQSLHAILAGRYPEAARFLVYGELFGGAYPHPDVPGAPGVQAVQTGVWYCPDVAFRAFDVARVTEGVREWLSVEEAGEHLTGSGVPFCAPLLVGALGDVMALSVEFTTTIPGLLGLPPLPDNLAEGLVIKPLTCAVVETSRGPVRPVIKRKHPRFDEDDRFHAAQRWEPAPIQSAPLDVLEWGVLSRINANRIASARSKLGPAAGHAVMVAEVIADVWLDVTEEHPDLVAALSAEDRTLLEAVGEEEAMRLLTGG